MNSKEALTVYIYSSKKVFLKNDNFELCLVFRNPSLICDCLTYKHQTF